jgi:hypothetical protein
VGRGQQGGIAQGRRALQSLLVQRLGSVQLALDVRERIRKLMA